MQANETSLQNMLTGTKVFELPYFQRRYKWGATDWQELWDDLIEQYDHPDVINGIQTENQGHFLGSVVLHPAPGPASTVARYLLIDGQQRVTTLLALIAALRDSRGQHDRSWNPNAYTDVYLTNPYNPDHRQRLIPTFKDRESYRLTIHEGIPTGQIGRAYRFFARELGRLASRDGGTIHYSRFEHALLLRMLVVDITTAQSDNVNHIFHTLNHAGQKLSPLDLIRNHTFMQLAEDRVDGFYEKWLEIETRLGEARMERYLWAQLVRSDPKASQRNLYGAYEQRLAILRRTLKLVEAEAVEQELSRVHREVDLYDAIDNPRAYLDQMQEGGAAAAPPEAVMSMLDELHAWSSQVHLPLSLEILSRLQDHRCTEAEAVSSLEHILSFMVRRALCGIPTNNLNRVFTGLPTVLANGLPLNKQIATFLSSEQRYWPTDREVFERSMTTPLYLSVRPEQMRFIMTRLEAALRGALDYVPESVSVQHMAPTRLTQAWTAYLIGVGADPELVVTRAHTLGNLVLAPLNQRLGQGSFPEKRELVNSEPFLINADVGAADLWTDHEIASRSTALARLATAVWRRPELEGAGVVNSGAPGIPEILMELPEDQWTTLEALSEFMAETPSAVRLEIDGLDPVLAVKVLSDRGQLPDWLEPERRALLAQQLFSAGYDLSGSIYDSATPLDAQQLSDLVSHSQALNDGPQ